MYWANFFHFYQPIEQQPDILEAIVAQSYRPIFRFLARQTKARVTVNVNGSLLELFDRHQYRDLLDDLRAMGREGRVEFTGSAKYHAFLPLLEGEEVLRQIRLNNETNAFYLEKAYAPRGFFPPEMGFAAELAPLVAEAGFSWILLDEIACGGVAGRVDYSKIYEAQGTPLKVFFRERRLSNLIMSAVVRSTTSLREALRDDLRSPRYAVTAMDGETFGHHRPGLEKLLFQILSSPAFRFVQISDLTKLYRKTATIAPVRSTWASSEDDIQRGIQFLSWSDPENMIHRWQWKFLRLVLREVQKMRPSGAIYARVRKKMDIALASDHFWWASAKPWWSLEMIEDGAFRLLDTLRSVPKVQKKKLEAASVCYEKIISTAFEWQRTGKIRRMMAEQNAALRIPFQDRTLGRGGEERGVYHAFRAMMRRLETKAARVGEYEKAILWRDAMIKFEQKLDIYDTVNAIDLLRIEIPHERVERTIERYKKRYRKIRGGQPEQRGA